MSNQDAKILEKGFYLLLEARYSSSEGQLTGFDVSVYNNTPYMLNTSLEISFSNFEAEAHELELMPDDCLEFSELNLEQYHAAPHFEFEMNWAHLHNIICKKIKPKGKHVSRLAEWIEQIDARAYYLEIWKPASDKKKIVKPIAKEEKQVKIDPNIIREMMLDNRSVGSKHDIEEASDKVDIHADKLGLSEVDISKGALEYQLEEFETALDRALANNLPSLLIIHGRGTGILRKEVHRRLKLHPMIHSFELCNDSGATCVRIY